MKRFQRFVIILILLGIALLTYGLELRDQYVVPIINYHEVGPNVRADNFLNVTVENFEAQMSFLKQHKYNVISLDELVSAIIKRKPLAHNSVVLTFDDGYANNYQYAFPILKKYGFPATIFIAVRLVGKKNYLTWKQIKEMEKSGIVFGSQTLNHAYLPDLSPGRQKKEIYASKKIIERHLGHGINHFCYPRGGFSNEIKELVKRAGYASACTTNRGYHRFNRDVYELKRIRFANKYATPVVFWAKLSGYYNFFKRAVSPY
jgi:peptidoglycan/xylan/chitin deacetylase (PgdA/CDA1 family)